LEIVYSQTQKTPIQIHVVCLGNTEFTSYYIDAA
jgi:hypothetical protein